MFNKILLIAVAGALGSLARYGLGSVVQRAVGVGFPWCTTVVNVIGCLMFGIVVGRWRNTGWKLAVLSECLPWWDSWVRLPLSAPFSSRRAQLLRDSQWMMACGKPVSCRTRWG